VVALRQRHYYSRERITPEPIKGIAESDVAGKFLGYLKCVLISAVAAGACKLQTA